jgi:hypothetical protein
MVTATSSRLSGGEQRLATAVRTPSLKLSVFALSNETPLSVKDSVATAAVGLAVGAAEGRADGDGVGLVVGRAVGAGEARTVGTEEGVGVEHTAVSLELFSSEV